MGTFQLTLRLLLGVVLILALAFAVVLWNGAHRQRLALDEATEQHITALTDLAAGGVAKAAAQGDRHQLFAVLDGLKNYRSLRFAAVFNDSRERMVALGEPPDLRQSVALPAAALREVDDGILLIEQPLRFDGRSVGILQLGFEVSSTAMIVNRTLMTSTILAVIATVLGTVLVVLVARPSVRAVSRLMRELEPLVKGEWDTRLSQHNDMADPVAGQINQVLDQLQGSRNELRQQHEHALQESRRLNGLLSGINAIVWEVDPASGRFTYVSDEAEALSGHPPSRWLEQGFTEQYVHPSDRDWLVGFLTHLGNAAHTFNLDFRLFGQNGDTIWLRMISTLEMRDLGPVLTGLLLDITEEKRSEQRIAYLADHDPLTGLINRRRFQEKLEEQIGYNRRYQATGALLFMDLDQFKYINDTYGHQTGDEYLRQVAHHLRSALRKTDTIGRLGGDEFGVLLPRVDARQTARVCEGLLKYLNGREFIYEGRRTPFTASIGVAMFPEHSDKASDLLARADSAMYNAKEQGRNTFRIYEENIDSARMREKVHWEARIRQALAEDGFLLYFQPIVDLSSGRISHYESLLRMKGDNGEIIPPGAFIGVAERFGLIREIDHWVVANAMRAQGKSEVFGRPVSLTINLSGRHFGGQDIIDVITQNTERYKANPANVVFEVTETAAVENFTDACDLIQVLREKGYRFALDDFGAGFSSFDYLKHMPVDYVKIDGSFVRNLAKDKVDRIFVNAINEMARGLNVQTIAEFVEDQATVDVLRELNVPLGQGYFFARPSPRFHEHNRIVLESLAQASGG